jgi:phosphoribosylglycinamide formyltransferase-1
MMQPFRIAVFASGIGTNFQAIVDAAASGKLDVIVELLVCDRPQAPVVERARLAGVSTFVFRPKDYASREIYEAEIIAELEARQIDLIVMAGYMRLITDTLVKPYYGRIINVHPSLLPAFPGVNSIGQAFEYGVKLTGVTVHFVDGGMDSGPVIAQRAVEVTSDDTEATLAERIHALEHLLYPQAIALIRAGRVRLHERKVFID